MNARSKQPEPKEHWGTIYVSYHVNPYVIVDDALGEYSSKDRLLKEVEAEYAKTSDGMIKLEIYALLDMCYPSDERITRICSNIKANLEKKYYYKVEVSIENISTEY